MLNVLKTYGWNLEPVRASAAAWLQWTLNEQLSLALRPEIFNDDRGLITGTEQTLRAVTGTLKYELTTGRQRFVGTVELRYDSTDANPGTFTDGADDRPASNQALLYAGA